MKHIVLTGGGTAGHVTPNIAMIPALKEQGFTISYIGSYNGIEKKLIEEMGIPYYGISSGKLRRYFDVKNFTDPFRVLKGFSEARKLLKKLKPDVVFSKGGFVSVPVVIAAKRCKIPAIIHESDMTPGLANKLCIPSAVKVCCNFPETVSKLPADKAVLTGTPIRQELLQGDPEAALRFTGLKAGIIGLGKSGGMIADALRFFGAEIAYFARSEKEWAREKGYSFLPLDQLLEQSEAVFCCLNKNTVLLHEAEFRKLGDKKILFNTGLSPAWDEEPFVKWLSGNNLCFCDTVGALGGAHLLEHPHVRCVQASTGRTRQAFDRLSEKVLANLSEYNG